MSGFRSIEVLQSQGMAAADAVNFKRFLTEPGSPPLKAL
jgi:hypothetical protein